MEGPTNGGRKEQALRHMLDYQAGVVVPNPTFLNKLEVCIDQARLGRVSYAGTDEPS